MYIEERYHDLPFLKKTEYCHISRDGAIQSRQEEILAEHLLEVFLDGQPVMKLICLPCHLAELVLGRLLTEQFISDPEEVKHIRISESGTRAEVSLKRKASFCTSACSRAFSLQKCSTIDTTGTAASDLSAGRREKLTPIFWKAEWIFHMADTFADGMPLHSLTFSTHSCLLAREGEILFSCEDIGRHNALDKVIGHALRHQIDLRECMVYSSGRIPTDMVQKAIRAGIPLLSSKASPTAAAIALAEEYHLTLICAARRDRMKVFSDHS